MRNARTKVPSTVALREFGEYRGCCKTSTSKQNGWQTSTQEWGQRAGTRTRELGLRAGALEWGQRTGTPR